MQPAELSLVISTGGPAQSYQAGSYNNFSMRELLAPFQQTAQMIGMTYLPPFILHGAMTTDPAVINASVQAVITHVTNPRLSPNAPMPENTQNPRKLAQTEVSLGLR